MSIWIKKTTQRVIHTHFIDRLALGNSLVSGIALFPQAIKVFLVGSTNGVALLTAVLIWINSLVWLAYAIHRGLISVALSASLNVVASTLLLISFFVFPG